MATRLDHSREAKIDKRKQLEELGINVHPYTFAVSHPISSAKESIGTKVTCAGRIMAIREHGKVSFATLRDNSSEMQLMFRSDDLSKSYDTLNLIDTGDYLGVEGIVIETKTGEVTIQVASFSILSKSLRPLPNTWQGIGDPEVRYRKRYLDMIISPDVKRILDARFLIEKEIRRYLQDVQKFTEVETPILQPLYGGTNAKPFTTHMNALDSDFYLRIAPELYLKRLIIGGYERIFEIARNFRNEGIDQTHQPEFTMMEWYEAYADYNRVMDVAEGMIKHLVQKLYGKGQLQVGEHTVNVEDNWPRVTMKDAVKQHLHIDIDKATDEQLKDELETRHIQLTGTFSRGKAIFALFDKTVPEKLIQPTWIIDYPKEVSPLSKEHRDNKEFVERFECYIGGKEMCDGWSEITDALEQRKRFEVEQKHMREGDEEAQPTDEEFLEAMEYGMPPLGGIGIGIDRLVMFLTNVWSIKEVIAFPTLRPLKKLKLTKPTKTQENSRFSIEQKVEEDFDGIFFSYISINNVTVRKMDQVLEDAKKSLYESKKTLTTDDIGKLRPIDAYRKLFKATGVDFHSKRPSPEALLRRIAQGKNLYTINTGVDAYNLSVIESSVGLGGFDADKIVGSVSLRYSKSGEQMHLLGDETPTTLEDGSLVYADDKHPITLHVNYRDIDETKITTETKNIILFADGAPGLSEEVVNAALLKGAEYIQKYCGGTISNINTVR